MLSSKDPERIPFYQQGLDAHAEVVRARRPGDHAGSRCRSRATTLPAYFTKAARTDGSPAPTMIMWNGLDSTKEHMYTSGLAAGDGRSAGSPR